MKLIKQQTTIDANGNKSDIQVWYDKETHNYTVIKGLVFKLKGIAKIGKND